MRIKVKADGINLNIPFPASMACSAVKLIPDALFEKARREVEPPFDKLVSKETAVELCRHCGEIFRENKGLEIVHAELSDGTFVSIKL